MTKYEYTTIRWEGSITTLTPRGAATTGPAVTTDVLDRFNDLGADGWPLIGIAAAPLVTGRNSPRGGTTATGYSDKVHYLATNCSATETAPRHGKRQRSRGRAD